jgi:hypothetical protein
MSWDTSCTGVDRFPPNLTRVLTGRLGSATHRTKLHSRGGSMLSVQSLQQLGNDGHRGKPRKSKRSAPTRPMTECWVVIYNLRFTLDDPVSVLSLGALSILFKGASRPFPFGAAASRAPDQEGEICVTAVRPRRSSPVHERRTS